MMSLNFIFRYLTCLGPALLCMIISLWSAFQETTVYNDFVRKDKRKGGQISSNYHFPSNSLSYNSAGLLAVP